MRKASKYAFGLLACLILVSSAHGDAYPVNTIYPVTGVITFTGSSVIETIDLSFDFSWPSADTGNISNMILSESGPLLFVATDGQFNFAALPYLGLFDGMGDELDLLNIVNLASPDTSEPPDISALVYSCISATCEGDFAPVICAYNCGQPETFFSARFSSALPYIDTPEPPMFISLTLGLGLLALVAAAAKRALSSSASAGGVFR